jgi:hypothetical protein
MEEQIAQNLKTKFKAMSFQFVANHMERPIVVGERDAKTRLNRSLAQPSNSSRKCELSKSIAN